MKSSLQSVQRRSWSERIALLTSHRRGGPFDRHLIHNAGKSEQRVRDDDLLQYHRSGRESPEFMQSSGRSQYMRDSA